MPASGNPVRKSPCGLTCFLGNRDRTLVESATARASTGDQTLELQRDVMRAEDCERIFEGTLGRNGRVPALRDTFDHRSAGARLSRWWLGRIGHSLKDLLRCSGSSRPIRLTPAGGRLCVGLFDCLGEG